MSKTNEAISDLLVRYHDLPEGSKAEFGDYTSIYNYGGCETCGPEYEREFDIHWTTPDGKRGFKTITGDPLGHLAEMLSWEDRKN